jgi:hypothetical protein
MKRFWYPLFLLFITFLAVACGGTTSSSPVEETAVSGEADTAVVNTANTNDLTLIGETGRPQLLNAYASW